MSMQRLADVWTAALAGQLTAPLTADQVAALMKIARGTMRLAEIPVAEKRAPLKPQPFTPIYTKPRPTDDAWDAPPVAVVEAGDAETVESAPTAPDADRWDIETSMRLVTLRSAGTPYASIAKAIGIPAEECEREFERALRDAGEPVVGEPSPDRGEQAAPDPEAITSPEPREPAAPEPEQAEQVTAPPPPPEPEPDPFDDGSGLFWNDRRNAELLRLRGEEGKGYPDIAGLLGTTAAACVNQYGKLRSAERQRNGSYARAAAAAVESAEARLRKLPPAPAPATVEDPPKPEPEPDRQAPAMGKKSSFQFNNCTIGEGPQHMAARPAPVIDGTGKQPFEATDENIRTLLRMKTLGHTYGEIAAITGGDTHELSTKWATYSKQAKWWHVIEEAREEARKRKARSRR